MEEITSLAQLPPGTQYVMVPESELRLAHDMATRSDPATVAAVREFRSVLCSRTLRLNTAGLGFPAVFDDLVARFWRDAFDGLVLTMFAFGFCPYQRVLSRADCTIDESWGAEHTAARNKLVAAGDPRVDPRHPTTNLYTVPVIPAFGTYDVCVFSDATRQTRVLVLPKAKQGDFFGVGVGGGNTNDPDRKVLPIHTLAFDTDYLPDVVTGALRSRVAALAPSFLRLRDALVRAAAAERVRAKPLLYVQYNLTGFGAGGGSNGLLQSFANQEYADTIPGSADEARPTYQIAQSGTELLMQESERHVARVVADLERSARAGVAESLTPVPFVLPPTMALAPHPPMPEIPGRLDALREEHVLRVATVFRLCPSMVGVTGAAPPTPEERIGLVDVFEDVRDTVLGLLDGLFADLVVEAPRTARFTSRSPAGGVNFVQPRNDPFVVAEAQFKFAPIATAPVLPPTAAAATKRKRTKAKPAKRHRRKKSESESSGSDDSDSDASTSKKK